MWGCVYLSQDALVVAGAEGGDDAGARRVSVQPLQTHAAPGRAAAAGRGCGVNVSAAPLTQRGFLLLRAAPPPPLPVGTRCTG